MWRRPRGKFNKNERLVGKLKRAEIVRLYRLGISTCNIAKRDGTSKTTILYILRMLNEPRRQGGAPKKHGASALAHKFSVAPQTYLRFQLIKKLGCRCIRCGNTDPRVLTINHLSEKLKKLGTEEMVRILAGDTENVDVRCANCQVLYEYERGRFKNHLNLLKHLF